MGRTGREQPDAEKARRWARRRPDGRTERRILDRAFPAAAMALLGSGLVALLRGGLRARCLVLGAAGIYLSALLVAWAARCDGLEALGGNGAILRHSDRSASSRSLTAGLFLFGGFVLVALAIQIPIVRTLDASAVRTISHCGGPALTRLMRRISNAGGRDLLVYWVPASIATLYALGRGRSVRFLVAAMLGTVGLEAYFKALLLRARPDLGHGQYPDSFPSGHALATTVLAGTLLVATLSSCRRPWQQFLIWSVAAGSSLLMAAARVYLDCHYFTDVIGGLLLGAAWVCFCHALLLARSWPGAWTAPSSLAASPREEFTRA